METTISQTEAACGCMGERTARLQSSSNVLT